MKRWEYSGDIKIMSFHKYIEYCQEKGQQGWELCGVQWHSGEVVAVWKREIITSKTERQ